MSLFVAVTHRAGALLAAAACCRRRPSQRTRASSARSTASANASSTAWTRATRALLHLALAHRPTVFAVGIAALVVVAVVLLPRIGFELAAADRRGRGHGRRRAGRRARASRSPRRCCIGLEDGDHAARAGGDDAHHPGRRRRRRLRRRLDATAATSTSGSCRRTSARARATRSRMDLRRQLSGIPGVDRPRPRLGRQQPDEPRPGRRRRRRPPVARDPRPRPRRRAQAVAQDAKDVLDTDAGHRRRRGSAATRAVRSWPCGSIATRRRCSA